jgi:hypothetical protein
MQFDVGKQFTGTINSRESMLAVFLVAVEAVTLGFSVPEATSDRKDRQQTFSTPAA